MYVLITVFFIAAKRKEIFRLFDDFRKPNGLERDRCRNNSPYRCIMVEKNRSFDSATHHIILP